jgi:hypothetical protein
MKYRFLLWFNALIFCIYLSGHLFDIFIIVPNWNVGSLEAIQLYNTFFHVTDPRYFFSYIRPLSIGLSLICLLVFWNRGSPLRVLLFFSLMIDILIYGVSFFYFSPMNEYLFLDESIAYDLALVKEYSSRWVASNYIRIALLTVGVYTSLRAVHFSYTTGSR